MSSGTSVTLTLYFNRHHYNSIAEIDEEIVETKQDIEKVWATIKALCVATPKDVTPQGEEPLYFICHCLEDNRELLNDYESRLYALECIKRGWDTREED